jgi:hypothetical protein
VCQHNSFSPFTCSESRERSRGRVGLHSRLSHAERCVAARIRGIQRRVEEVAHAADDGAHFAEILERAGAVAAD